MQSVFYYDTGIGKIAVAENGKSVTHILFMTERIPKGLMVQETPLIAETVRQIEEYAEGKRKTFDVPVEFNGTSFQMKAWKALQTIPYGEVRSYKQMAEQIGSPKAFRAVGLANNRNPISIIVPCHRVIGSDGSMIGYAGGMDVKRRLLEMERRLSKL